jgi:hypothetical protein
LVGIIPRNNASYRLILSKTEQAWEIIKYHLIKTRVFS